MYFPSNKSSQYHLCRVLDENKCNNQTLIISEGNMFAVTKRNKEQIKNENEITKRNL